MADTVESLEIQITHRASGAASALRSLTSSLNSVSKATKPATSALGNFVSSLKRIAFYRFIRSIIKGITQAFQEGLQQAYIFSSGISGEGHRFAEALDSMKASGNQLKGQLGSAFAALLTAIEPILTKIINLCISVADAIAQLLSAFTGTRYLKATKTAAQFADTMKAGGGAAKEWKNQLLGFDEINRLNEPNNGGGGGGGSSPSGFDFEDAPINQKLLDFINMLKEKLQPAIDRLKEGFERLKEAWDRFADSFDGSKLQQLIVDLLTLGGELIINGLTVLADTLTLVLDVLTAINTGDWSHVWVSFKQLLYDVIVLVADLLVGITNLIMDALIIVAGVIDSLIGTDLAGWLQNDKDKFNEMYRASKESEEGLLGLKTALGLTEKSTKNAATEADKFTTALSGVDSQSETTETKVRGIRGAVDWVLDGFRGFGYEVGNIITSLFQPLADLAAWIQHVLDGFGLLSGINARVSAMESNGSIYLQGFASGGHPDEGQLFIARESGAEMVGSMGGRTTVATNDDIVEGIRIGVYDAVSAAMNGSSNDVNVRVFLDSREIKIGQQRLNRTMGVG